MSGRYHKNTRSGRHQRKKKSAPPPAVTAEVMIKNLGAKGDGLATYEDCTVHIPFTAPGDEILARVIGDRGILQEIISSSPNRVDPVCPHFGECGGCALQHIAPPYQSEWKMERVSQALSREGIEGVSILPSPAIPHNTRRRATFSVHRFDTDYTIGFKARNTHRIIPLEECHLLDQSLFEARLLISPIIDKLPNGWNEFTIQINKCNSGFDFNLNTKGEVTDLDVSFIEQAATLFRDGGIIRFSVNAEVLFAFGDAYLEFEDIPIAIPPGAFLQASEEGQQALLKAVRAVLSTHDVSEGDQLADLFCGCGAFALPLSRAYEIHAVDNHYEGVGAMVTAYKQQAGFKNLTGEVRDLFRQPLLPDELASFQVVLFDPPRAGAPAQAKQMAQTDIPLIIGVSCNPASFARDARLLAKGGYTLTQVQLVDQFAWSPHIELVGSFVKKDV